jgi:hypothetical protein
VVLLANGALDIMHFGNVVTRLLGGREMVTFDEHYRDDDLGPPLVVQCGDPDVFKVPGCIVGTIVHLGPSYNDIMSKPENSGEWTLAIEVHLSEWIDRYQQNREIEMGWTFEENEAFQEVLEELDNADKERIFSFDQGFSWDTRDFTWDTRNSRPSYDHYKAGCRNAFITNKTVVEQSYLKGASCDDLRLGLLSKEISCKDEVSAICLLPSKARMGDFICQFPRHDLAAVVRRSEDLVTYIGCAGLAKGYDKLHQQKKEGASSLPKFSSRDFSERDYYDIVEFYMHITTLYEISR